MNTCIACGGERPGAGYGAGMGRSLVWHVDQWGPLCAACAQATAAARNAAIKGGAAVEDTEHLMEAKR